MLPLVAAVRTSEYQLLKLRVLEYVPITKDAAHVYIGMLCLLVTVALLRGRLSAWWALVPGLIVSVVMEVFDFRDDLRAYGHWRVLASLHDIVNTNLLPLLTVVMARRRWIRP